MTKPPNPITQGFSAVRREPIVVFVEIVWRWAFAIIALASLFATGFMLLGPLHLGDSFAFAWRTHDTQKLGILALSVLLRVGKQLLAAAILVPLVIVLSWSFLATAGRRLTVKRLRPGRASLRFGGMLAVQLMRGFLTWIAGLLAVSSITGGIYIATRSSHPDLFRFYMIVPPALVLIGIFWLILNWYFSLAAIFGCEGQGFRAAFRQARAIVRLQRSDFFGTAFVFLLLRVVLLLIVVAVCGLTSSMVGSAPEPYFAMVLALFAVYCALADILYLARMAAYLALAAAYREPGVLEMLAASSKLPAGE